MAKKKPITPNSQIVACLRRLWLYSRERRERLRLDDSTCWVCKRKASSSKKHQLKVEVHHIDPVNFKRIIKVIREELLVGPEDLMTLCKDDHKAEHGDKTCKSPFTGCIGE